MKKIKKITLQQAMQGGDLLSEMKTFKLYGGRSPIIGDDSGSGDSGSGDSGSGDGIRFYISRCPFFGNCKQICY